MYSYLSYFYIFKMNNKKPNPDQMEKSMQGTS